MPHKDPFDEMLLIHAQQLGARFLTRDRLLVDHPLAISP
jgi:PIN domain nuclease of toxin-antitoxin system